MKTRSGHKYVEGKTEETAQIKSPPKQAKSVKSKAKSEVKEKTNEAKVVKNDLKRTRTQPNTEVNTKKTDDTKVENKTEVRSTRSRANTDVEKVVPKSPKKSPKKPVINTKKESPKKPAKTAKKKAPEVTPEPDVVLPPIQEENKRALRRGRAQTVVTEKESVVTKKPKSKVTQKLEQREIDLKEEQKVEEEDKVSDEKPIEPLNEKKETEKESPKEIPSVKSNEIINKEVKTIEKTETEVTPIEPEVVSSAKPEQNDSKRGLRKAKAQTVVTKKQKPKVGQKLEKKEIVLTEEQKTEEQDVVVSDEKPTEPLNKKEETESPEIEIPSVKINEVNKEMEKMDTTESEVIPLEPEVSSAKRKSSHTNDLPQKHEAIKRFRVSRFTVPSIPQVCGQLYSFGKDIAGECGLRLKSVDGIKIKLNEPSVVTDKDELPLDNVVSVVCGAMHSSCLSSEGEVLTFGCNDDSALGRDTQTCPDETDDSIDVDESEEREAKTPKVVPGISSVVKMTAGDMHTCALCKDGSVYVWGNFKDESKKLGLFSDSSKSESSDDFNATKHPKRIQMETKIVDIASGCHHILLLSEDGDVFSFGEGSKGQLGRIKDTELQSISNDRQLFLNPQKVEFGVGIVVEKIWANSWSSYAKTSSGDIYVWGLNNYHQLGFKSNGSVRIPNSDPNESQQTLDLIIELKPIKSEGMPPNIVMIANGQHHMVALDADGRVFSCGSNTYGKLGYKTETSDQTSETPQMISADAFNGQKVKYISCGEFCSFAVTESGHLMAWGQGSEQIGTDFGNDLLVPTRVKGSLADNIRFVSVSSGSSHCILIGNKNTINGN